MDWTGPSRLEPALSLLAVGRGQNPEAVALSPAIGWLLLACVLALAALILLQREAWRRFWFRTEDPRAIGLFRVVFAGLVLANINGLWEHLEFLFTDEGLFLTESARQVVAPRQFAGYGDGFGGDPAGFFDARAVLRFLQGPRYSLLFFWDSPTAFWIHLAAFELVMLLFLIGWRSRITGLLGFVLMTSIANRNPIYWTGADVVFRTLFLFLVLSRSGHAYSIDNWLRCRRLRRSGRLDEASGPRRGAGKAADAEHPHGLAAIYRRIPAWPRVLMILQVATVYFTTGCLKTGSVWARGDSLYYALQLDHFYRVPTQVICDVFGTNLFRLSTWIVHFWQIGFPLLVLGLVLRWAARENLPPPGRVRGWAIRVAWIVLGLGALAITVVALPVHYPREFRPSVEIVQALTVAGWLAGMGLVGWGYHRLRWRPFEFTLRGHPVRVDIEAFFRWLFGRRLWLALGVVFHMQILVLMNIGMFAPIMIGAYLAFLNGTEVSVLLRHLGAVAARLRIPGARQLLARPRAVTEDASLPHLHHETDPGHSGRPMTWAYGRLGRVLVGSFIALHISAVAAWLMPAKDCTSSFRATPREIAGMWLAPLQAQQSWSMFAPNPLRQNVFMLVHVTDRNGAVWDMYTDANSPRNKAMPWIWYDRAGKITRRVTGAGKHYQKWVLRYHCRKWAMEHAGELPEKVEMYKSWYDIPPPRSVAPYRPEERLEQFGHTQRVGTARCADVVDGQPTNEIRRRHGFEPVDEAQLKRWNKQRERRWQAR